MKQEILVFASCALHNVIKNILESHKYYLDFKMKLLKQDFKERNLFSIKEIQTLIR